MVPGTHGPLYSWHTGFSCVSRALEHPGLSAHGTQALAVSHGPWDTPASVLVHTDFSCVSWALGHLGLSAHGTQALAVSHGPGTPGPQYSCTQALAVSHGPGNTRGSVLVHTDFSCVSWALGPLGLSTHGTQALAVSHGPGNTRASVLVAHGLHLCLMGPWTPRPQYLWHMGFSCVSRALGHLGLSTHGT